MPQAETLRVKGYREFARAVARAPRDTRREVRAAFREVGEIVQEPWSEELERFGTKTARGIRTRVRQRGIGVEQSLRKTTGRRPDFGFRQQLIGDVILAEREDEIEERFEEAMDDVADRFERS